MAVAKRQEAGSRVDNLASSSFSSSLLRLVDHSHVSIAPTHTGSVAPSHVPNAFTFSPPLCYPLPSRIPACLSLSSPRCRSRSRQSRSHSRNTALVPPLLYVPYPFSASLLRRHICVSAQLTTWLLVPCSQIMLLASLFSVGFAAQFPFVHGCLISTPARVSICSAYASYNRGSDWLGQ